MPRARGKQQEGDPGGQPGDEAAAGKIVAAQHQVEGEQVDDEK
jgi:hypothetical protein